MLVLVEHNLYKDGTISGTFVIEGFNKKKEIMDFLFGDGIRGEMDTLFTIDGTPVTIGEKCFSIAEAITYTGHANDNHSDA